MPPASRTTGSEAAVAVLLPGLLCDRAVWEGQLAALGARAPCIVPDYGELDSLTAMAQSVLAQAPPRFALAGHSMGGRVALEILRTAPARVSALSSRREGATMSRTHMRPMARIPSDEAISSSACRRRASLSPAGAGARAS